MTLPDESTESFNQSPYSYVTDYTTLKKGRIVNNMSEGFLKD